MKEKTRGESWKKKFQGFLGEQTNPPRPPQQSGYCQLEQKKERENKKEMRVEDKKD